MVPPPLLPQSNRPSDDANSAAGPCEDFAARHHAVAEFGPSASEPLRVSAVQVTPLLGGESSIPGGIAIIGTPTERLAYIAGGRISRTPGRHPDDSTLYDLASLTKVVATLPAVLRLVETGAVDIDAPLGTYVPGTRGRATASLSVRSVLTHTSGLSGQTGLWKLGGSREDLFEHVFQSAVDERADFVYANRGFILLGALVEAVAGCRLDEYVRREIWTPLGMHDTFFNPSPHLRDRIAPTEASVDGAMVHGTVHDENARVLDGVSGHAGAFSTAHDLALYCNFMLTGSTTSGAAPISRATLRMSLKESSPGRGLGWAASSTPDGETVFGHHGFTGTSIWLVPDHNIYAVLLSNRIHPTREDTDTIFTLRTLLRSCLRDVTAPPASSSS